MNSTRGSELLANATVQLPETVVWPDEAVFVDHGNINVILTRESVVMNYQHRC